MNKCPICGKEMKIMMLEAMGHSYYCTECKHQVDYDFDKGKCLIDGIVPNKETTNE